MTATTPRTETSTRYWYVRSDTDKNAWYCLHTDARGVVRCQCRAALFGKCCKHVRAVARGEAREARPVRRASAETATLTVAGDGFGFVAPAEVL